MRRTTIITAKLRDEFLPSILNGSKRYEVRDEPFGDAQAIRYISATSGKDLGLFSLGDRFPVDRSEEGRLVGLAAIPEERFRELFPDIANGGPEILWVAEILGQVDIRTILEESR